MKVREGDKVSPGKPLAEYNPNNVVSGYTGEVIFEHLDLKDGMVVSESGIVQIATQEFDQVKKEFIIEEYKIPQGATLKVGDNDIIHAGNVLAEISAEQHAAIARVDGTVKFENIRVKNRQVISDNGMVFIFPKDVDPARDRKEYPLPRGVKEARDLTVKTGGMILNIKNGDPVSPGERLLSVVSEAEGILHLSANGTALAVSKDVVEEFEFKGELEARIDKKNQELSLIAPISGVVRTISEKSAANKTLDRKRVIIKNEIEYSVPRGVILRPKENCKIPNGQDVLDGGELTTKMVIQAEIDGVAELVHAKAEKRVHLISEDLGILNNAVLSRPLMNRDTEEELAASGIKIDEDLLAIINEHRSEIREIYLLAGETDAVNIRGEDQTIQYIIPPGGQIAVDDGQLVKAGDKVVSDIDPIKSEITGKVNYIYGYNKVICEEIIEKILVYSGVEFSYPATLNLKFERTAVKGGELTAVPIPFEEIEQMDPDEATGGSGIRLRQRVTHEKKYKITREMAAALSVLVKDGQKIKEGQTLAAMTSSNKGVVLLERMLSKEGKTKTTINKIVIQPGEAYQILDGAELRIEDGQEVKKGEIIAKWGLAGRKTTDIIQGLPRVAELFEVRRPKKEAVISEEAGIIKISGTTISITDINTNVEKPIRVQYAAPGLVVHDGEYIEAGDSITDGKVFPKKLVKVVGLPNARRYLIDEIQRVYRDQGVSINDKHLEIIVRQMLRKINITDPGDTEFLPNESIHVKNFEDKVHRMTQAKKRPPSGYPMIQGITKASLTTDSFISAASFQETTRVLTKAAIKSKVDFLKGLKENLIIGKLIPAGTGLSIKHKVTFKNLPAEVEKVESASEELFMNESDEAGLKKLEDELFIKSSNGEEPEEPR